MRLVRLRDRNENDVEVVDLDSLLPEAFSERGNKFVIIKGGEASLCVMVDSESAMLDAKGYLDESVIEDFLAKD